MSPDEMKTILITGGAGFIGSEFVTQLVRKGFGIIVLDALTYAGHKENLAHLSADSYEFVEGDIRDSRLVLDLLQSRPVDAVVNFAAESHVDHSITRPATFVETNVFGTCSLLEASLAYWQDLSGKRKKEFRYLQVSTDEVFGSLGETGKFSNASQISPNSPYSASKAGADHFVRAWFHTYGLPTVITNCSNNYGPRQFPEKLIPLMITHALAEKPLPVYGTGKNVRDWIHVSDHCQGIEKALFNGEPGKTYLFGGNAEYTNIDVVQLICRELDRVRPRSNQKKYEDLISYVEDRLGHDFRYAIDDSESIRELGFQRKFDFQSGLMQTIDWYLSNDAWVDFMLNVANQGPSKKNELPTPKETSSSLA